MKACWKALLLLIKIGGAFFGITFFIYIFNLDMKLTAALEPFIHKLQDRVEKDRHL